MTNVRQAYETLVQGVNSVLTSEAWKEFLKFHSRFHNYSFNNTLLIYFQRPDATLVAGYKTWQSMGRYVKKGEKGIKILAPLIGKKKIETEDGEEKEVTFLKGFKVVSVFDICQTDGKELPTICKHLEGDSDAAKKLWDALLNIINIPIGEEDMDQSVNGYYSPKDDRIALRKGLSLNQKVKTLIHEYVHSKLDREDSEIKQARNQAEVVAESVAFIVASHYGLDTSEYSFGYVTIWAGAEVEEILKVGDLIQKTASDIIEKVNISLNTAA